MSVMVWSNEPFVVQGANMASWPSVVQGDMGSGPGPGHRSAGPGRMCLSEATLAQYPYLTAHNVMYGDFWLPLQATSDCLVRCFMGSERWDEPSWYEHTRNVLLLIAVAKYLTKTT